MKVLVIDDSRAMRALLKRTVADMGHDVAEAGDGRAAIDVLNAAGPFDLCLVDWNMPIMNGFEFISAVRGDPKHANVKLMMVTTEVEMSQISKALDAGANEYLMKPFTPATLAEKVSYLLAA